MSSIPLFLLCAQLTQQQALELVLSNLCQAPGESELGNPAMCVSVDYWLRGCLSLLWGSGDQGRAGGWMGYLTMVNRIGRKCIQLPDLQKTQTHAQPILIPTLQEQNLASGL